MGERTHFTIMILGLTYKPGFDDMTRSPSIRLIRELSMKTNPFRICVYDPFVTDVEEIRPALIAQGISKARAEDIIVVYDAESMTTTSEDGTGNLAWQHPSVVVVATGHEAFRYPPAVEEGDGSAFPWRLVVQDRPLIFDACKLVDEDAVRTDFRCHVYGIGQSDPFWFDSLEDLTWYRNKV